MIIIPSIPITSHQDKQNPIHWKYIYNPQKMKNWAKRELEMEPGWSKWSKQATETRLQMRSLISSTNLSFSRFFTYPTTRRWSHGYVRENFQLRILKLLSLSLSKILIFCIYMCKRANVNRGGDWGESDFWGKFRRLRKQFCFSLFEFDSSFSTFSGFPFNGFFGKIRSLSLLLLKKGKL